MEKLFAGIVDNPPVAQLYVEGVEKLSTRHVDKYGKMGHFVEKVEKLSTRHVDGSVIYRLLRGKCGKLIHILCG